jgi:hypothetical protein
MGVITVPRPFFPAIALHDIQALVVAFLCRHSQQKWLFVSGM